MALFSLNIEAEGRQQVVFVEADGFAADVRDAFAEATDGVTVTNVQTVDDDAWYSTDREGIMVTQEEGDVEYAEPILSTEDLTAWGSDSARSLIEDAGVSEGYRQVAAEVAGKAVALDEDDLARVANALRLAITNGMHAASKVRDQDMSAVIVGMTGSYRQTLAKVEGMLDD